MVKDLAVGHPASMSKNLRTGKGPGRALWRGRVGAAWEVGANRPQRCPVWLLYGNELWSTHVDSYQFGQEIPIARRRVGPEVKHGRESLRAKHAQDVLRALSFGLVSCLSGKPCQIGNSRGRISPKNFKRLHGRFCALDFGLDHEKAIDVVNEPQRGPGGEPEGWGWWFVFCPGNEEWKAVGSDCIDRRTDFSDSLLGLVTQLYERYFGPLLLDPIRKRPTAVCGLRRFISQKEDDQRCGNREGRGHRNPQLHGVDCGIRFVNERAN